MGFRSSSRKGLALLGSLVPVFGIGYYAADPANFTIATEAVAHAKDFASSVHVRTPLSARGEKHPGISPDVGRLFTVASKGPRADRYMAGTRSPAQERPVRLASLTTNDAETTGSLPAQEAGRGAMDQSRKADRAAPLPSKEAPPTHYTVENKPSSSLFMASLAPAQSFKFPGSTAATAGEQEALKPAGPTKLPRGLAFQGETEDEYQGRQRRCLATAIYFEARGEPERGQLAVAQVVMNRVRSSIYPDTICGVVYQGQRQRKGCQFSFTCDGIADIPKEKEQWTQANRLAKNVLDGKVWLSEIGHATHYHANYVRPAWRRQMKHVKKVGQHIFYRVRYPQLEDVLKSDENQATSLALR